MNEILNSYLFQHNSISIPGLGTIYIEKVPARTDFVSKQVYPPRYLFLFDKYNDAPEKDFFTYLAAKKRVPDYEAIKQYNEFAHELCTAIKLKEQADWKGIGSFRKNAAGEIIFEQTYQATHLDSAVIAERVIRSNTSHAVLVGDKEKTSFEMTELLNDENGKVTLKKELWWIYAVILFALGLLILFFHFYRNGFSWESIANQQRLQFIMPAQK